MTAKPAAGLPTGKPMRDVPKQRLCLRCKTAFLSQWSGERICSRCKSSNAWKRGEPRRSV